MRGRRQPYTQRGIARVPCVKCGAPSRFQWRICSTDRWHAVCTEHDIEINQLVAQWAFGEAAGLIIARYREGIGA